MTGPDRRAAKALVALVEMSRPWAACLLAALLAASWSVVHLGGGAAVVVPHAYYLPVLLAAVRFGHRAALAVALVAGVLAGPATYQLVALQQAQTVTGWTTRTIAFVAVGQLVAWLFQHARGSVQEQARLGRADVQLGRAILAGELSLRYQPVVRSDDGHLVAFEALVRWDHPDGVRGPDTFVPLAERTGRIHDLGRFVLDAACEQATTWHRLAWAAGRQPPMVSINVGAAQLGCDTFVHAVRTALERTGLPAEQLCLEVTEEALVADLEGSARRLRTLRDLGVHIAVDDFGTGFSSLAYVHRFPLDGLKIDRSFVLDLEHHAGARALVGQIVGLCGRLGLTVVAEGIETAEQHRLLQELGCPLVQGYHVARPLTAEQVPPWLRRLAPLPLAPSPDRVDAEPQVRTASTADTRTRTV